MDNSLVCGGGSASAMINQKPLSSRLVGLQTPTDFQLCFGKYIHIFFHAPRCFLYTTFMKD